MSVVIRGPAPVERLGPKTARGTDVPSMSALLAFEATARLGSITRAAEERDTSHSVISRHVRALERSFGTALFERHGRGMVLTEKGRGYFLAVQPAMEAIQDAGREIGGRGIVLIIGCTLEIFILLLSPVFFQLRRTLGDEVAIRFVVSDHGSLPFLMSSEMDIAMGWKDSPLPDPSMAPVLREEVVPVASPAFVERRGEVLAKHPREWRGVPRLSLATDFHPWMTWNSWFDTQGCEPPDAPTTKYEHYFHMLPAAAEGSGVAIGWNSCITDYLDSGRLVPVRGEWMRTELALYAVATPNGVKKDATYACIAEMGRLFQRLSRPEIASPIQLSE